MALDEDKVEGCLARRVVVNVGVDELERVRIDLAVPGRWVLTGRGGGDVSALEAPGEDMLGGAMTASVESAAWRPHDTLQCCWRELR